MKLLGSGFAIATMALLFALAAPSMAQQSQRWTLAYTVNNASDACAWITTYWSYKSEAHWRINNGKGRPNWAGPNGVLQGQIVFNYRGLTPQVRFLAEVRPSAQCSGSGGTRIGSSTADFPLGRQNQSHVFGRLVGSRASG
ncbi:MAG: hypothetical protein WBE25_12555, partial [Xanthobacteraceae bacterium]